MNQSLLTADPRLPICGACGRGAPFDGPFQGPEKQCSACWLWYYHGSERSCEIWAPPAARAAARRGGPPLLRMLATLVRGLWRLIYSGRAGRKLAERRLAICGRCDLYDHERKKCQVCGCGQFKPQVKKERCPIGKW